jgi:uncharacterized repeat protein (TIGR02543 family)
MRYIISKFLVLLLATSSVVIAQTSVNAASFQLTWSDNSSNEDGFNIERKTGSGGSFSRIATIGANTSSYVNTGLADNTIYCYRVNAFNSAGVSPYTSEACGKTPAAAYALTVSSQGSGTVTSSPTGINCGSSSCIASFASGTTVVLQAVAAQGYTFAGWGGDCNNDGSVTMNTNKTCTATFNLLPQTFIQNFSLTVAKAGAGTVTSTSAGINCGPDCSEVYTSGTSVTLNAVPAQGSNFIGWSGVCSGTDPCTLTVRANTSVRATFAELNVARIGVFQAGKWYLDVDGNGTWDSSIDRSVQSFGGYGDRPVIGIAASTDAAAIFRAVETTTSGKRTKILNGLWHMDSNNNGKLEESCDIDQCLGPFGEQGDLPVIGDWAGTGPRIGIFRPADSKWYLDLNGNGKLDNCVKDRCLGPFGHPDDLPVAGDWTGTGQVRIGVFNTTTAAWQLDFNGNGVFDGCTVDGGLDGLDGCLSFGQKGDLPVAGDWTGTGKAQIGIFDPITGTWELDRNGNGVFDGCEVDLCFGPLVQPQPGDLPVAGIW